MLTTDFSRVSRFVADRAECHIPAAGGAAIGWLRDDKIVAGVLYEDFTGEGGSITATIAIEPGAILTRHMIWAMFDYPFLRLKVKKLLALIHSSNHKSRRLVEHLGFRISSGITGYYPDGNLIVYEMTADECRWLGEENGQESQDPASA